MSSDADINVQMYNELKKVEGEQTNKREITNYSRYASSLVLVYIESCFQEVDAECLISRLFNKYLEYTY